MSTEVNKRVSSSPSDGDEQSRQAVDDSWSYYIFKNNTDLEESTSELNGQFIHSQLLIDRLLKMKFTSMAKEEFVDFCQNHKNYKDVEIHPRHVQEFLKEYSPNTALRCYTKNTFVHLMLNAALRQQDVDAIYRMRFIIRDLEQQLKERQSSFLKPVYRGQLMSKKELNRLKQSTNKLISFNSFLSTTRNYETARIFAGNVSNSEQVSVIFKINADHGLGDIRPFADISGLSAHGQEEEILFMFGSIFRVDSDQGEEDGTIKLTLCRDHDLDVKPIFDHLQYESSQCELDLLAYGNVLHDMSKFDKAKSYYDKCLNGLPPDDDLWKAYCYYLLGLIATEKDDNKSALNWFEKSRHIRICRLQPSDPRIADTLNAIARVYYNEENYDMALQLYKEALTIFQNAFGNDHLTSAMCYTNLGLVYTVQQNYSDALKYHEKAYQIRHNHLPNDHFRFGTSYNNIGEVHLHSGDFTLAWEYFEWALQVYRKSLPLQHVDIAKTLSNMGSIYEQQGKSQQASLSYNKAIHICQRVPLAENLDLIKIQDTMRHNETAKQETFIKLFHKYKCIASLDPRTSSRKAQHYTEKNPTHVLSDFDTSCAPIVFSCTPILCHCTYLYFPPFVKEECGCEWECSRSDWPVCARLPIRLDKWTPTVISAEHRCVEVGKSIVAQPNHELTHTHSHNRTHNHIQTRTRTHTHSHTHTLNFGK